MGGGSNIGMNICASKVREVEPTEYIQDNPLEEEVHVNTAKPDNKLRRLVDNIHHELYPERICPTIARPQV
jgi:hypothetical protein